MISEIIAGAVKGVYDVVKSTISPSKCTISQLLPDSLSIQKKLENVREQLGADRAYILQFHNGGYFFTGGSMQRLSCTFESTNAWTKPLIEDLQAILVTRFPGILARIAQGESYIPDTSVEDSTITSSTSFFQKHGIKTFLGVAIYDLNGNFTGMLGINYVGAKHEMTDKEKEIVHDFAKTSLGFIVRENNDNRNNRSVKIFTYVIGAAVITQIIQFFSTIVGAALPWIFSHPNMIHDIIKELTTFL